MDIKNELLTRKSLLSFCVLLLTTPVHAGIFKCVTANGKTGYQQEPCAATASTEIIHGALNVAPVATRAETRKQLSQAKQKNRYKKSRKRRSAGKHESAYARRMRVHNAMVKGDVVKGMNRKQVARALSDMKKTGDSRLKNYDSETSRGKNGAHATVRYDKDGFVEEYHGRRTKELLLNKVYNRTG